uniref:Uncharacterized protein n=1 Tax=Kalanchoe fedtschenkoi TaxID=63787 RepID=A0A7N0SX61_KALFE
MSWFRTAVHRAVEASGNNNLTRTVRNYADTVVLHAGHAVAGGAKIIQGRFGPRNMQSFRQALKRLEEASVSCRGIERVQLLRRWLASLREAETILETSLAMNEGEAEQYHPTVEYQDSPRRPATIMYYDPDVGGDPMNFRDVFLHSQALEGITLSMILEEPNPEELAILSQIFRLCLTGGQEPQNAILDSIQDLAKVFSSYQDEVLVKREELLQYAQSAIAGLKLHADLARIDAQASTLQKKLSEIKASQHLSIDGHEKSSERRSMSSAEDLKEALAQVQLCSKLEELLLKKKSVSNGDSPQDHAQKLDKLKVLAESLASSTSKAEKRIWDHSRFQKEEALSFRMTKANEISQLEKDLAMEIAALENQKYMLEAELKKVNTSLASALARLRNAREEREQFDEASDQIVTLLKLKEDELSRSISVCREEANAVNTWIKFLDDTWVLQTSYTKQKEKQVNEELEKCGEYFVNLAIQLLSAFKDELGPSIIHLKELADNLHSLEGGEQRRKLIDNYLDSEAKISTAFSVVDRMRDRFGSQSKDLYRKDGELVMELLEAVGKQRQDFESITRPQLTVDTESQSSGTPIKSAPQKGLFVNVDEDKGDSSVPKPDDHSESHYIKVEVLTPQAKVTKIESRTGQIHRDSAEDINDWEFD